MIAELTFYETQSGFLKVSMDEEKLYVKSSDSEETFALRSLNGIGISHNTKKFQAEKEKAGSSANNKVVGGILIAGGGFGAVWSFMNDLGWMTAAEMLALVAAGFMLYGLAPQEIVMESALTLTVGGGEKKFVFPNKDYPDPTIPEDIAAFISRVQDTLTAYNSGS